MRLLDRYILKKLFLLFSIIVPAFLFVSLLVQVLEKFKKFKTINTFDFLQYIIFQIPDKLYYIIPIGAVTAVIFLYRDLIQTKKIYAIFINGISVRYLSGLAILFAFLISIFQIINLELLMPTSKQLAEESYKRLKGTKEKDVEYLFTSDTWIKLDDYKYIYFGFLDLNNYKGKDFVFIQMNKENFFPLYRIEALEVKIKKGNILLQDGRIVSLGEIENFSYNSFKNIEFPINIDIENLKNLIRIKKPVSISQLYRKATIADRFGYPSGYFWSRFFSKITTVFSAIILIIFITPILWLKMKEKYIIVFSSIFVYWYSIPTLSSLAESGAIPYFSSLFVNIIYIMVGISLILKQKFTEL